MTREAVLRWAHNRLDKLASRCINTANQIEKAKRKAAAEKKAGKDHPGSIALDGSSFTVGEAIEALRKMDPNDKMWVCINGGDTQAMTGCGFIGYHLRGMFGCDEAVWVPMFAALSPEREAANRKYRKNST